MPLPSIPNPRGSVEIGNGISLEVRGLSYAEQLRMASIEDTERQSIFLIAQGCEVSSDEAAAWLEVTPVDAVQPIVDKILELSGYGAAGFPDDGASPD